MAMCEICAEIGVGWLHDKLAEAQQQIEALTQQGHICECGTTMVCPDIGCDANKSATARAEGRAEWQPMASIQGEILKAAAKFPDWPVRGTDAAAIVAEECGELQQAVLQLTYEGGSVEAVRKEAVQTAAMAIQFLLNLPDATFDRGVQIPKRLPSVPGEDAHIHDRQTIAAWLALPPVSDEDSK